MNVSQDLSILHLILNASAVVQVVMVLLAAVSFMSWYYIFGKWFALKSARSQTEQFERDFWSGGDLNSLYQSAVNNRHGTGSMERIFESGFREFTKLRSQKNLEAKDIIDGSRRAMRATYQREAERAIAHLASIGIRRIAILHVDDSFGRDGLEGAQKGLAAAQLSAALVAKFDRATPDFTAIAPQSVTDIPVCDSEGTPQARMPVLPFWLRTPFFYPSIFLPHFPSCAPIFSPTFLPQNSLRFCEEKVTSWVFRSSLAGRLAYNLKWQ